MSGTNEGTTVDGRPRVSLVITTKNRASFVGPTIESALALDASRFELEIVVVDDGSTDDTSDVLARYPVRSIRTEGVGMAKARWLGVEAATGSFVTLLDDDDILLPAAIVSQLAVFDRHPEYALVHAQATITGPDLTPFGDPFPYGPLASGRILRQVLGYFPQVGTILTRIEAAREAGPFDATLTGDNDWDWLLRIVKRHEVGAVEVPVLLFRQRDQPEEAQDWRRYPALGTIFHRHTDDLPFVERLKLRPILWRHRGWWASIFLNHAEGNWRNGDRRRALRSVSYAARASLPHTLSGLGRRALARARARFGR